MASFLLQFLRPEPYLFIKGNLICSASLVTFSHSWVTLALEASVSSALNLGIMDCPTWNCLSSTQRISAGIVIIELLL